MHEGPRSGENAKGGGFYSPLRNLWERALFIPGIPPDFWMQISTLVGIKDNSGAGPSSVIVPAFFHRLQNVSLANRHPSRKLASLKLTRSGRKLRIYGSQEPAATFSTTSRLEFANMFGVRGNP